MAPNCPEEVDVFTIPHSRMKELVKKYLNMVSEINFADISHLTNLLENLVNTFKEFKAHEQIENKYIMKKLKDKLRALSVRNTAVCNCHSDNQLTDILELVQDGYKCTQKTETDRKNFGTKLRKALEDFTETFIPHMEEEEAVFQPMLIKYFTTDELRKIKFKVLEKHFCQNDNCAKEKFPEKTDFVLSDSSDEECTEKLEPTKEDVVPSVNSCVVDKVPDEVAIQIFSYLNPQDLGRCAQVSHRWNRLALDTSLWRNFLPIQWSKGVWSFTPMVDIEVEEQSLLENKDECVAIYYDEDADIDESEEDDDTKRIKKIKMETSMLTSMMKYLLPKVGYGVKTINLAFSQGLVNGLLYKMLSLCPLVENLDLTHTRVSDLGFKSLGRNGCGGNLKRVDLAGCKNITDVTLERLSQALRSKPEIRQEDSDDNNHEEKNEIELNEKGDKSPKDSHCHVTCRQTIKEQTVHEDCNISFTNDIEDHSPRTSESLTNQKGRSVDLTVAATPTLKVGYVTEESPRLTFNTGNISLFGQRTSLCCPKNCCFESASVKHFDQHSKNMNFKCLTDIDELTKICAVKHGHESEIICDNLECGLEYLSLSGCSHITDKGIRALVIDQQTFPALQFLDLSGCDKVTSLALTDLVSVCTSLDHQFLYYCDNVTADPYSDSASGCQNLECPTRACCRTGC
ncbi:F-box/LRR-repeat protein 5-like [Mytilus edulis]|uniref:F-box/LRR-repeat protein 5-like n=1 Tax=Mytilus edulis TaxID=6550 RepID=UPI0039EEB122